MEPLRIHIAELVIADDPASADVATADAVTERATAAGHAVVGRVVVKDTELAIREQLKLWIAKPDVDVVIVTGAAESTTAGAALRPLVTQPIAGFTDLFRWLAFQEIGASAMQSNAEAAQCGTTFVFVLPAVIGAVRAAMDKLINPQLDPATTPKNLVTQIPRLQPLVDAARARAQKEPAQEPPKREAVPRPIGPEKTEGGLGMPARLPARKAPTGQHVVRKDPAPDVTRQVDRAQLERDLQASTAHDAPTKPSIDIRSVIPRVPPGADEDVLAVGDDTDLTDIPAPQPFARVKLAKQPAVSTPSKRKPPTVQIPALPKAGQDEVTHEVPAVRSETLVTKAAPPSPGRPDTEVSPPPSAVFANKPNAERRMPPALTPPAGTKSITPKSKRVATPDLDVVSIEELAAQAELDGPIEDDEAVIVGKKPVDDRDEALTTPKPRLPRAEAVVAADPPRPARRPPTEPPPPPRVKRPPTAPPPPPRAIRTATAELDQAELVGASAIVAVATGTAPLRAKRTPTEPPPPRESNDDLPRGKFDYPVQSSATGRVVKWALLALLAAGAGIAFVKVFVIDRQQVAPAQPRADAAQVAIVTPDAAAEVVAPPPDAAAEIEVDGSNAGSSDSSTGSDRGSATHPNGGRPDTGHATGGHTGPDTGHATGGHTGPDTGHATGGHTGPNTGHATGGHTGGQPALPAVDAGVVATPPPAPPSDPTCDEVSCVMEKYARPCCARYKPSDSGFKPTAGVPEELDRTMVRAGIDKVKPRVISCGEKTPAKGTVKIAVVVTPEGDVKEANLVDAPVAELGTCVAAALRGAHFGRTAKGGSFTYPFAF